MKRDCPFCVREGTKLPKKKKRFMIPTLTMTRRQSSLE